MFGFLVGGFAGGDDADTFVFDFDVHDSEQTPFGVTPDGGIAGFFIARSVDQPEKWIKKHFSGFFKRNAMLLLIACGFGRVPHKRQAV